MYSQNSPFAMVLATGVPARLSPHLPGTKYHTIKNRAVVLHIIRHGKCTSKAARKPLEETRGVGPNLFKASLAVRYSSS